MITHVPGFSHFKDFLHHFVMDKLATSSIRVVICIKCFQINSKRVSKKHVT